MADNPNIGMIFFLAASVPWPLVGEGPALQAENVSVPKQRALHAEQPLRTKAPAVLAFNTSFLQVPLTYSDFEAFPKEATAPRDILKAYGGKRTMLLRVVKEGTSIKGRMGIEIASSSDGLCNLDLRDPEKSAMRSFADNAFHVHQVERSEASKMVLEQRGYTVMQELWSDIPFLDTSDTSAAPTITDCGREDWQVCLFSHVSQRAHLCSRVVWCAPHSVTCCRRWHRDYRNAGAAWAILGSETWGC